MPKRKEYYLCEYCGKQVHRIQTKLDVAITSLEERKSKIAKERR